MNAPKVDPAYDIPQAIARSLSKYWLIMAGNKLVTKPIPIPFCCPTHITDTKQNRFSVKIILINKNVLIKLNLGEVL